MPNIFTYGSLMFDAVWGSVVDGTYNCSSALLEGYIRKAIVSRLYPAVLAQPGSPGVAGILYFDVIAHDITRLDLFEGRLYTRKRQPVLLPERTRLMAEVYVIKDCYRHLVSEKDWDPDHFESTAIHSFMRNYIGFHTSDD